MCNIHWHGVITNEIQAKGSGYFGTKHMCDVQNGFSMSNDAQWLGFNMELGPDGSIYVIDWHDSDICGRKVLHQKTGRLWRYSYGDAKFPVGMDLIKKSDAELVEMHLHANDWYARQARRLMHERSLAKKLDPATHQSLMKILRSDRDVSLRLRAMWTLGLVGGLSDMVLLTLLDDKEEHVRGWAIQMFAEDGKVPAGILKRLATLAKSDPSSVVRLYLASAMQRLEPSQRWDVLEGLVAHSEDKDDHNLPLMYWYAIEPLVELDGEKTAKLEAACKIDKIKGFIKRRQNGGKKAAVPVDKKRWKAIAAKGAKERPELFAHYREVLSGGEPKARRPRSRKGSVRQSLRAVSCPERKGRGLQDRLSPTNRLPISTTFSPTSSIPMPRSRRITATKNSS